MRRFRSAVADYEFVGDDLVVTLADPQARRVRADFSLARDRTRQEFRAECNPNNVIRRYAVTGELGRLNPRTGQYLDVAEIPDLLGCLEQVQGALQAFRELPEDVRAIVHDSPARLVALADHQAAVKAYQAANPPPTPPTRGVPVSEPVAAPGSSPASPPVG